jgi:pimeloyl-ACP methyl ester carboxylesterase
MRIDVGNEIQVNYVEEGQGVPLVFSSPPGFNVTSKEQMNLFSPRCRVISYYGRGHKEAGNAEWYSYAASCRELAALLQALDVDKAVVYGGSGGGIMALHFALLFPDRTRAIIVDGTSAAVNEMAAKMWYKAGVDTIQTGKDPLGIFAEGDPLATLAFYHGIADLYESPLEPRLKDITCPVLILIGEEDKRAGVGGSVRMNRAIPGSQIRIMPGSGHTVLGTTPEVAQKEILAFIESLN